MKEEDRRKLEKRGVRAAWGQSDRPAALQGLGCPLATGLPLGFLDDPGREANAVDLGGR